MARILDGGHIDIPLERADSYLFRNMEKHGDNVFLTNATRATNSTFSEILETSRRLATYLQAQGLGKGDIITLYGPNSAEFVCVVLGGLHAGLTVNSLNPASTVYELRHYFKEVQPKAIFTEASLLANAQEAVDVVKCKPRFLLREQTAGYDDVTTACAVYDVINVVQYQTDVVNDVAFIMFSSGTSGLPKGVMLTHHNVVSQDVRHAMSGDIPPDVNRLFSMFPMFHGGGMFTTIFITVSLGLNLVFMEKYKLEQMLRFLEKYTPESIFLPPSVIVAMAKSSLVEKYDLTSIKYCLTGAAPLKTETEDIFKRKLNTIISQSYGLTEIVSATIWQVSYPRRTEGQGSCGKVGPGMEIKLINPSTGKTLGPNTRGEILLRGPMVMKGYLNNSEATQATVDEQGWLHSGDVGYYDDDGYMYIVDRLKELIKYKSNQVAPAELEAAILDHPGVADVGVVGVDSPEAGEVPRAYVVRKEGSDLVPDDLHKYINDRVAYYKRLRGGVFFVSEIPKLRSGKIQRWKLKDLIKLDSKL